MKKGLAFEAMGLIVGSFGAALMLTIGHVGHALPTVVSDAFRGGEPGAAIAGLCIVWGLLSTIAFPINLLRGEHDSWLARSLLVLLFLGMCAAMGASY